jgi:hypothetical protein
MLHDIDIPGPQGPLWVNVTPLPYRASLSVFKNKRWLLV